MKTLVFVLLQLSIYQKNIDSLVNIFKSRPETRYSSVSISIRNNKTGAEIYQKNSDVAMAPASTLKLLTTASGLKVLGAEYRFKSEVLIIGSIVNDTLYGNLEVNGNRNPTFGSKRFGIETINSIKDHLLAKNIKVISGKIKIYEDNVRKEVPLNWPLGDVGNYYGAYPGEFNFNENYFSVYFNGSHKIGEPAKIQNIYPNITETLISEVFTASAGSGDQVNFVHSTFYGPILAIGTVPQNVKNFEIKGSLVNPKEAFINTLQLSLLQNGIQVLNQDFNSNIEKYILYEEFSPPVSELIKTVNLKSLNFYADALFEEIKFISNFKDSEINKFYNNVFLNDSLQFDSFIINDGSGLSPSNTFNVSFFTTFLNKVSKTDKHNVFKESMPVWGKTGTVASYDKNNKTKGAIWAKSGSVQGVRNFAGYFKVKNEEYSFAIFTNGINDTARLFFRDYIEKFMILMVDIGQ